VIAAAGVKRIRLHDLRHTDVSQLVMNGVPLRTVQEQLDHGTLTMTLRYSHLSPGVARNAVETLVPRHDQGTVSSLDDFRARKNPVDSAT
jgi:site-specific recombinase XerD